MKTWMILGNSLKNLTAIRPIRGYSFIQNQKQCQSAHQFRIVRNPFIPMMSARCNQVCQHHALIMQPKPQACRERCRAGHYHLWCRNHRYQRVFKNHILEKLAIPIPSPRYRLKLNIIRWLHFKNRPKEKAVTSHIHQHCSHRQSVLRLHVLWNHQRIAFSWTYGGAFCSS